MKFIFRQNGHYLNKVYTYVYYAEFVINPANYTVDLIKYPFPSSLPAGYTDPTGNFPFVTSNLTNVHIAIEKTGKINEFF